MSLVGFTLLGSLEAPSVTGSASDAPMLVKFEDFTTAMLSNLDSGGGDLRFSSDEAGTTQLACEVVTFTKATGDVVWVSVPSISSGSTIYVWGDNAGATQPAVTAAFGRNEVWSNAGINLAIHQGTNVDSSGNHSVSLIGSPSLSTGKWGGQGYLSNNSAQRLEVSHSTETNYNKDYSVDMWVNAAIASSQVYFGKTNTAGNRGTQFRGSSTTLTTEDLGNNISPTNLSSAYLGTETSDRRVSTVTDNTTRTQYSNGQVIGTDSPSGSKTTTTNALRIACTEDNYEFALNGVIGEYWSAIPARTTNREIEQSNQAATGSWWIAANAGGAISVTPNAINSGSVSNNPTISYSSVLNLAPSVIDSASVSLDPAIQFGGVLSLAPLAIDSASLALNPVINYSSVLNITPLAIDSLSVAVDPTISYTSALVLSPQVIDSQSLSINPLIEYKSVINLTSNTINSFSVSLDPIITTGEVQTLGNITAGFADDLYSVKYKLSGITVNFKG